MAHTVEMAVCTVNSLAAMPPAMAGLGRWMNNMGTTKNPSVLRLPHHTAATHKGRALIASDVRDLYDLIGLDAARGLHLDRIAF